MDFTNPNGGGSWTDFLNNVVNATTRIITTARQPTNTTTIPLNPPTQQTAGVGSGSMAGLLVLAVLVIVVMKS